MYGRGSLLLGDDGKPARMLGTVQDVTDRKQAALTAERLKQIEIHHKQALELNDEIVQGIAAAKLALELDQQDRALTSLQATIERARTIVSDLLRKADLGPGDLIRKTPPADDPDQS
jgi:hypothetical protein